MEKLKEWNLVLHGAHPTGPPHLPPVVSAHQHLNLISRLQGDPRGGRQRGECTDTRTLCQGRHPQHPSQARAGSSPLNQGPQGAPWF